MDMHSPMPRTLWRKLPYALLLASLLVFGFLPRLLTEKIKPDAQKIVASWHVAGCSSAKTRRAVAS